MVENILPIHEVLPEIREKLSQHHALILQAPPGAGKSTIVPLELLNESWLSGKKIFMLEPRRLAARAVANRMSSLLNEQIGNTVGYRVRFENRIGENTRIEVLTEGILTRMMQSDNSLEEAGLVIFDEFHERSLHADLAFALCLQVQEILRPDLKILVMSATMETDFLSSLLKGAPVVKSSGRQFPVTIKYFPSEKDSTIAKQTSRAIKKALSEEEGDLLVFLPGAGEISTCMELLEDNLSEATVLPLYGDLPFSKQQNAILPDPSGKRKIVLATSIAETSLTIEGIKVVIDSGYSRLPRFDLRSGLTRLETVNVTRDSADQRAGRAGRLGPGICYRLWSETEHLHLQAHRKPEILEADLASLVLESSQWGVKDIFSLTWPTPPPTGSVKQAIEVLEKLDAIDNNAITEKGKAMLRLPTHPRIAHMLLEGKEKGLSFLAADIAAILDERDPLPKETSVDLSLRVEALRKWRKKELVFADRNVLERIEKLSIAWKKNLQKGENNLQENSSLEDIGMLIAAAYPERVAMQREIFKPAFKLANGRNARLPDNDSLIREKWIAIATLDAGMKEGRIFLAATVDPRDLPFMIKETEVLRWDFQEGKLHARKEFRLGELLVESKASKNIDLEKKISVLCEALKAQPGMLNWDEDTENFIARTNSAKTWQPDNKWPDMGKENLVSTVEDWLGPFLEKVQRSEDFFKIRLREILENLLPWELRKKLEVISPEKIMVPTGSAITLKYFSDGSPPVLAVRLQEMFGLRSSPTVNQGKIKVMMHLLSPAYRPVQVTQDIESFWDNTYPEVRKELRMRYPKHSWPEDPRTAEPVKGAKKKKRIT